MKRAAIAFGIVILLIIGFVGMQFAGQKGKIAAENKKLRESDYTVKTEEISSRVVETGVIDAVKMVEVKSRVSGRVKQLLVDEGDSVVAGQLIAVIDPRETQLQVNQSRAQLRGAQANVARTQIEIEQRRINSIAVVRQQELRVEQLRAETRTQPVLTQAAIRQAKASLETSLNEVQRLETTAHPNSRLASESSVREAQANFDNATSEYERQNALFKDGFVSQRVVENAELTLRLADVRLKQALENNSRVGTQLRLELEAAQDAVRRARAAYDTAVANSFQDENKRRDYLTAVAELAKSRAALKDVAALVQSKASTQASVDQIASQLDDSLRNLGETEIRAPLTGIVSKKLVQEGELVSGLSSFNAGTPIVRVEDRTTLRVTLAVNEIDTAKLKKGMEASVTVDAIPGKVFKGGVEKIAPASTAIGASTASSIVSTDTVVKYSVEIYLKETDARLRSGMSAKCDLVVEKADKALVIPIDYLGKEKDGTFYVAKPIMTIGAKPEKIPVKVGVQTGATVQILEGLKEGDVIGKPEFKGPARSGFMGGGPEDGE